jgi:DNA-directed RNA polymerase subunit L
LEATIARLYSVRTTVNDFTTKHPSLVDMGFRVQFAYEKAQVVLNEALETLTRLSELG